MYKSKLIMSEIVRVVEQREDCLSGGDDPASLSNSGRAAAVQERIQQAIREAFERGVAEGVQKGRDLQRRESASALQAAEDALRQTSHLKASIVERSEGEIIDLVFAIAEKVIHHEATVNPDIVKNVLRSAVEAITDRENIRVRCNPGDLTVLKDLRPELTCMIDGIGDVEFLEDSSIMPGGVKIGTGTGEVDARLDRQFEVIKNAVLS